MGLNHYNILFIGNIYGFNFGLLFAYKTLKAEAAESKLNGRFLMISFILFTVGSLIPYIWFDIWGLVTSRIILVFCVITFYFGLNMPQFVKNLILTQT